MLLIELLRVKLKTYYSFPTNDVSDVQDFITADRSEICIKNPPRSIGLSFLSIADSTYEALGAPNATIHLSILIRGGGIWGNGQQHYVINLN